MMKRIQVGCLGVDALDGLHGLDGVFGMSVNAQDAIANSD